MPAFDGGGRDRKEARSPDELRQKWAGVVAALGKKKSG
jgi:hypothetical protein